MRPRCRPLTSVKKARKPYWGILEADEGFLVGWHEAEAEIGGQRRPSALNGAQENGEGTKKGEVSEYPTKGMRRGGETAGVERKLR